MLGQSCKAKCVERKISSERVNETYVIASDKNPDAKRPAAVPNGAPLQPCQGKRRCDQLVTSLRGTM